MFGFIDIVFVRVVIFDFGFSKFIEEFKLFEYWILIGYLEYGLLDGFVFFGCVCVDELFGFFC